MAFPGETIITNHQNISRIVVLLLLLVGFGVFAQKITDTGLLTQLRQAPGKAEYPDSDALCLLRELEITVEPSGCYAIHERKLLKILTQDGLGLAQWQIPYDKADETLTIRSARTLLNETAYPVEEKLIRESSLYPGFAWYDGLMVSRFPLPAAAAGAVLEVDTVIKRNTPRIPGAFSSRIALQQSYPTLKSRFNIRIPSAQRLYLHFTGDLPSPKISESVQGAYRSYQWEQVKVPALQVREPRTPPLEELTPSACLTTLRSWAPVVTWYQRLTEGKDQVTDALRKLALERTRECTTPLQQLAALQHAVREVPYVAVEFGQASDQPHNAEAVALQNYGDCKEKATLLRSLLNAVGITSHYVLVRTNNRGPLDRTLYGADEFNHVMLLVHLPDGDRYVDATLEDAPLTQLPPGVAGAEGLVVRNDGELVTLPATDAASNATNIQVTIAVKDDGSATGSATLRFAGINGILQRGLLAQVPKERYREALEGYLSPRLGAGVTLTSVTITGMQEPEAPLQVSAEFTSPNYLQPAGNQLSGYLPIFAYQAHQLNALENRKYPFYEALSSSVHVRATITLPDSLKMQQLPPPADASTPYGVYHDSVSMNGNILNYQCALTVLHGQFPAKDAPLYYKWLAVLALDGRNQLQFFLQRR